MTTSDDRYPEAWRPKGAPPFPEPAPEPTPELAPLEVELHIAALTDEEFESLVKRTRPGH